MSRAVELAPRAAGGECARSNTGTLGTPGNTSGQFTVYNFQVEDYHTYYAAPEADKPFVWVHNANCGDRGLTFVEENLGTPRSPAMKAAREFENGTSGAYSSVASRNRVVPALKFDNPNPAGAPYVKFDGIEGNILIDAKTRILTFPTRAGLVTPKNVRETLQRVSEALRQNPGYKAVYEFPDEVARAEAQMILHKLRIKNISTRVRK